jgi:1-aminocyclopropane-1-carboxylate deaminase
MRPEQPLTNVDLTKLHLQKLHSPLLKIRNMEAFMLRADRIHPVVSGNKWFKLRFHLEKARQTGKKGLASFGGAFSNHLLATAYAGKWEGLPTVALVRGEKPTRLSPTLQEAAELGMELNFVSREQYSNKEELQQAFTGLYPDYHWIPEGGLSKEGIRGAATLLEGIDTSLFTDLFCAVGTGTMMAGLLRSAQAGQTVHGIPVLKVPYTQHNTWEELMAQQAATARYQLHYDHHEGGYARHTADLLRFMNEWYITEQIPTDFVYTGKLCKAFLHWAESVTPDEERRILLIHSGGLQGNRSLPPGSLVF